MKYKIMKGVITGDNPEIDLPEGFIILGHSHTIIDIGDAENPKPIEAWIVTYLEPMMAEGT